MKRLLSAGVAAAYAATQKGFSLIAAGIAFYMLLAIFPGATVAISLYGAFADPATVSGYLDELALVAPEAAIDFLRAMIDATLAAGGLQLSATAAVSLGVAVWSAGAAARAVMTALHLAFPAAQARTTIGYIVVMLLWTMASALTVAAIVGILVFAPVALETLRAISAVSRLNGALDLTPLLHLAVLPALTATILTVVYFAGAAPGRRRLASAFQAALLTTALWVVASRLLSTYLSWYGNLGSVYGPFAAAAVLMLWFWISALLLLYGAELAAALASKRSNGDDDEAIAAPA